MWKQDLLEKTGSLRPYLPMVYFVIDWVATMSCTGFPFWCVYLTRSLEATEPGRHGLPSLKQSANINLSSYRLLLSGI